MTLADEFDMVAIISNRWHDRDQNLWHVGLELAKAQGVTLLELIHRRLCELRDRAAREAFERQELECVVLWEHRLEVLRMAQGYQGYRREIA